MTNLDVVGFGALNLDKLFKVNMIAKQEEEAAVLGTQESGGGSAANTIVGLARLELKTGFVGKVADDREGKRLLDEFIQEGVDIKGVAVAKTGRSGTVMGFVDPNGDRALYVDPGVNDQLDMDDVDMDYVSGTEFLHITSFVSGKPFRVQKELVAKFSDLLVCFDPGALYVRRGLDAIKPIIQKSCAVFPNELELQLLTGHGYKEGAKKLLELGAGLVAVKLGKRGCYVTDGKESHMIEAYKVDAVDTTGAGDAFCAGFIYGLSNGKDLFDCGQLGNFVASRCVSKIGARTGLPRLADLKDL